MKIEKVLLCLDEAITVSAKKVGVRPATRLQLSVLYAIVRLQPCRNISIYNYLSKHKPDISPVTVSTSLQYLEKQGLILRSLQSFSISPLGREYLSRIRKYLLNKRL